MMSSFKSVDLRAIAMGLQPSQGLCKVQSWWWGHDSRQEADNMIQENMAPVDSNIFQEHTNTWIHYIYIYVYMYSSTFD